MTSSSEDQLSSARLLPSPHPRLHSREPRNDITAKSFQTATDFVPMEREPCTRSLEVDSATLVGNVMYSHQVCLSPLSLYISLVCEPRHVIRIYDTLHHQQSNNGCHGTTSVTERRHASVPGTN